MRPGAAKRGLIEAPKPRLKAAQRRVLDELLVHVPPHDAAHGFVHGGSARTHAAAHAGRPVVLGLDLRDFFLTVAAGRVHGVLRTGGSRAWPPPPARRTPAMPRTSRSRAPMARSPHCAAPFGTIVRAEGFAVHPAKTRFMTAAGRQHVTGVIVNAHPNLVRGEYDRLRAAVHHAERGDPYDRAQLLGRISWLASLNPARSAVVAAGVALR